MGQQSLARNALFLFCQLAKQRFYHLIMHEFGGWQAQPQAFTDTPLLNTMPGVARKNVTLAALLRTGSWTQRHACLSRAQLR
jgi:hypothetical protein